MNMLSKTITVNFSGFWNNFDYRTFLPFQLITKHYDVKISDNPDFLFCSIFDGFNFCKFDGVRIFCTSECFYPDMNLFDYALSILDINVPERTFLLPYYMYIPDILKLNNRKPVEKEDVGPGRRFCNFIYSHPAQMRDTLFHDISTYKQVDSAGRHLNNMEGFTPGSRESVSGTHNNPKIEFQSNYKFTIACENYVYRDYITEKIIHAYMARTIPIYYGAPNVLDVFNPKSFINIKEYNRSQILEIIRRIDNDNDLYIQMLNEPVFNNPNYLENIFSSLENFMVSIVEGGVKRPVNVNSASLNNSLLEYNELKKGFAYRLRNYLRR